MNDPQPPGIPHVVRSGLREHGDPFSTTTAPVSRRTAPPAAPHPASAPHPPAGQDTLFPCPCACGCGRDTAVPVSQVESATAAVWLRCEGCVTLGHLSAAYNKPLGEDTPVRTVQVRTAPDRSAEEKELDRMAAAAVDQISRDEAKARFYADLEDRWKDDRDDDVLDPRIEDRLRRMAVGKGQHGQGLLLIGGYGGGKTWLGYKYVREAIDRNLVWPTQVLCGTEAKLLNSVAFGGYEFAREMEKLLDKRYRIMFLDDVGNSASFKNEAQRHAIFSQVIDHAYANRLALVLSTNLVPGVGESLERWIGPAAYQRLKNIVGPDPIIREGDKRGELTQVWESEYRQSVERGDL